MPVDTASMQIPKDLIEPIIQAHVQKAILDALGDKTVILEQAVSQILNRRVDREGRLSDYSNDKTTWVQWVVQDCVRKAVVEAVTETMAAHKEVVKASIVRQLRAKKSPLADQLINAMTGAFTGENLKYRLQIQYAPE